MCDIYLLNVAIILAIINLFNYLIMSLSKVLSRNIKRTITKKLIYLTTKRP